MSEASPKICLSEDVLAACVRRFRHYRNIQFEFINTGKFNTSYFVKTDGEQLVLRIAPPPDTVFLFYERNMMKQEPRLHQLLRKRTSVPIPKIYYFDETHEILESDFLIMERLPGKPLTESPYYEIPEIHRQLGTYLAEVHRLTAATYGYVGPHEPMVPQRSWHEAFQIMWAKLLDDIAETGIYNKNEVKFLADLLEDRISLFKHPVPACLLHMDIWDQNILTANKRVTGILDWDRALWGDPEIEFAVLDYCGISTPTFWEGYGTPRDMSPEAAIRNMFYLLYEVQKYIVIRHGRNKDTRRAIAYKQHSFALANKVLSMG